MAREGGNDKKERKARHSIIEEHLKEHSEARGATPRPATTKHNKKEQKSVGFNTGPEGARCGKQQRKRQECTRAPATQKPKGPRKLQDRRKDHTVARPGPETKKHDKEL